MTKFTEHFAPPPPPLPTFNNTTAYRDIDTVPENYENYECIGSRGSGGLRSPEAEVFLAQSMPKTVSLPLSLNHIYIYIYIYIYIFLNTITVITINILKSTILKMARVRI